MRSRNFIVAIMGIAFFLVLEGCRQEEDSVVLTQIPIFPEDMAVELNPNGITPLSAVVRFQTGRPVKVTVEVMGKRPVKYSIDEMNQIHNVPVHGLYPDTLNSVRITLMDDQYNYDTQMLEIRTDPVYKGFPNISIDVNEEGDSNGDFFLSDLHLGNSGFFTSYPIIFDADGVVRWCMDLRSFEKITWPVHQSSTGTMICGNIDAVYEYSMLGEVVNVWAIPGYRSHHEVLEMPNGNLLVAVAKSGTTILKGGTSIESTDDHIVELNRASGMIVREWDIRKHLDVDRIDLTDGSGDWFHMNGITYSESDDCLIVSGRHQGVLKITGDDELVWIFAPKTGWGNAGAEGNGEPTEPYLLTAVNPSGTQYSPNLQSGISNTNSFDWPWGQHAPVLLDDGDLLLFDNGFNRLFTGSELYSRAVTYHIDDSKKTVQQVWDYGKEYGNSAYSVIISNAEWHEESGTMLMCPGFINDNGAKAKIIEVQYGSKNVVFEATISFKNLTVSGNPGWGTIDIIYRSHKFSF